MSLSYLADVVAGPPMTRFLTTLVAAALAGSVLLVLAWIAARLLRNASAASRHLVWAAALGGALVMPVLTTVVPRVEVAGLPRLESPGIVPSAVAPRAVPRRAAPIARPIAVAPLARSVSTRSIDGLALRRYVPLVWLTVFAFVLLRLVAGTLRVSAWTRRAESVDDGAWLQLVQRLAARLGIARPITLLRSERACVPMTWGVVYPTVLLPVDCDEWSSDRRTIVLLHELAHVKRFDALTQLIAQVAVAVFWFNPLVWLAARQMRREREHACDDFVLAAGARPTDYAHDLLMIARSLGGSSAPAAAALAMARHDEFEGRLLAILDPTTNRHEVSRSRTVFATLAVLVLALPLAALTPLSPAHAARPQVSRATPRRPVVDARRSREVSEAPSPRPPREIEPMAPAPAAAAPLPPIRDVPAPFGAMMVVPRIRDVPVARPAAGPDLETLIAVARRAAKMTSDYDKAEVLVSVADHYIRDDELRTAYLDAVATITSSYDQSRTLLPLLLKDDLPPRAVAQVVRIASLMSSDFDKASVLVTTINDHESLSPSIRDAMIASAGTIRSDYDRARTIAAIIERGGLTSGQLIDLIAIIKPISSSNDKANSLVALSSRYSVADKPLRDAFLQAAETISSSYDYRRAVTSVLR